MAIAREAAPVTGREELREIGLDRRGSPAAVPAHAAHARHRGARTHPLPPGQDPGLVLHRPRQRGDGRGRGERHARPRRRLPDAARHGRPHRARHRAVAHLRAVHGPRRRLHRRTRRQRAHGRLQARDDRDGLAPARHAAGRLRLRPGLQAARRAARGGRAGAATAAPRAATRTRR